MIKIYKPNEIPESIQNYLKEECPNDSKISIVLEFKAYTENKKEENNSIIRIFVIKYNTSRGIYPLKYITEFPQFEMFQIETTYESYNEEYRDYLFDVVNDCFESLKDGTTDDLLIFNSRHILKFDIYKYLIHKNKMVVQ